MSDREPILRLTDVHKSYRMGKVDLHVLRGVNLSVQPGEFLAVVGASGSGKSTMLHLMGLLDRAGRGSVCIDGAKVETMRARRRACIRRHEVGFVFQFYHLLPELNVLENVLIARMTALKPTRWLLHGGKARLEAVRLLDSLGLGERLRHRPRELSGGERQRVAIARALANNPKVLLADEPTGNLDSATGAEIMAVLKEFHRQRGQTLVMVTHDMSLAEQADRVVHLVDGTLGG